MPVVKFRRTGYCHGLRLPPGLTNLGRSLHNWTKPSMTTRFCNGSMDIRLNLTGLMARVAVGVAAIAGFSLLVLIIVSRFVIGTLSDDRISVTRDILQVPVEYFPGSARLNARLALAELSEGDRDLAKA